LAGFRNPVKGERKESKESGRGEMSREKIAEKASLPSKEDSGKNRGEGTESPSLKQDKGKVERGACAERIKGRGKNPKGEMRKQREGVESVGKLRKTEPEVGIKLSLRREMELRLTIVS